MSIYYDLNNEGTEVQQAIDKASIIKVTGDGTKYLANDGTYKSEGLSTNDFTNEEKSKLSTIQQGAQVNRPLYGTTGSNSNGSMTQRAVTDGLDSRVSKSFQKHVVYGTINDCDYDEEQELYAQEIWDTFSTATVSGVTFMVDKAAHTITVNGTASNDISKAYTFSSISVDENSRVSACPYVGSSWSSFIINDLPSDEKIYVAFMTSGAMGSYMFFADTGYGTDLSGDLLEMTIHIKQGTVCDNLIFKPRLRKYTLKSNIQESENFHTIIPYSQQNIPNSLVQRNENGDIEGLASSTGTLQYTIAAPNSVNKERADLILGTENPAQQIMDAITMLHTARGGNTDIAIRIDFMGGEVELSPDTYIVFPTGRDNIYIYGNGVKIIGNMGGGAAISCNAKCYFQDIEVINAGVKSFLVRNSVLVNCVGTNPSSFGYYPGIDCSDCVLVRCVGTASKGFGISGRRSTLIHCRGSGATLYDIAISGANNLLLGCDGTESGIVIEPGATVKPSTQELLEELNFGTITMEVE